MKTNIESYNAAIITDNKEYIDNTVAEYLLSTLNQESDYAEYFESEEIEFGVTNEQKEEVESFIKDNYDYL